MTSPYRALCAELFTKKSACTLQQRARSWPMPEIARKALDSYRYAYATELPYFLREDSNEYEPLMLAIRAAIAADRVRALLDRTGGADSHGDH
jgi:hypothetical protein